LLYSYIMDKQVIIAVAYWLWQHNICYQDSETLDLVVDKIIEVYNQQNRYNYINDRLNFIETNVTPSPWELILLNGELEMVYGDYPNGYSLCLSDGIWWFYEDAEADRIVPFNS